MANITYIDNFHKLSDSESDEEPKAKKQKQTPRIWLKKEEFQDAKTAEKAVNDKIIWKKSSCKNTVKGYRVDYRCTAGKYRSNECPASIYLLYHANSMKVSLFETQSDHANHVADPSRGLTAEMKLFITAKFEEGIRKPNDILNVMKICKMTEPCKSKLVTYLKQLRTEMPGSSTISAPELQLWCKDRIQVPVEDDKAFVLQYHIVAESLKTEEQDVQIVMSTTRLLHTLKMSSLIQINATYKLIWHGYSVLVVGTSDKNCTFHPIALAICKGESRDDYAFIFNVLHLFDLKWQPSILMADAEEAITAGFEEVFGAPRTRLMCYLHVLHNIEKYLKTFTEKAISGNLKHDIHFLQLCQDEATFQRASNLFLQKWSTSSNAQVRQFVQYFHEQWLIKNAMWYEGAAIGYPSSNDGIQSTTANIKRQYSFRERLPVGQFMTTVCTTLESWSVSRDPGSSNCIHFARSSTLETSDWTAAYQWALKNCKVIHETGDGSSSVYYTMSSTFGEPITPELLANFKTENYKTLDEFIKFNFGIWVITINEGNGIQSHCTCQYYLKKMKCKHSLGMLVRLKLVTVPDECKRVPLVQQRKRGCPAKTKRSLLVQ